MQSTRSRIIDLLHNLGEATVEDLTQHLVMAPSTVRRHLDVLQRDGQVAMRHVRRAAGRPHFVFTLTTAGHDALPHHHMRVTTGVIEELLALKPRDTKDKTGYELAYLVFDRMTGRLVKACKPSVTAEALPERLQQAVEALGSEGLEFHVSEHAGGYIVQGRGCPCRRIAGTPVEPCAHDQRLLSQLTGAHVDAIADPERPGVAAYLVRNRS
jgi:predicted ArsR family transcriptional regulator